MSTHSKETRRYRAKSGALPATGWHVELFVCVDRPTAERPTDRGKARKCVCVQKRLQCTVRCVHSPSPTGSRGFCLIEDGALRYVAGLGLGQRASLGHECETGFPLLQQ